MIRLTKDQHTLGVSNLNWTYTVFGRYAWAHRCAQHIVGHAQNELALRKNWDIFTFLEEHVFFAHRFFRFRLLNDRNNESTFLLLSKGDLILQYTYGTVIMFCFVLYKPLLDFLILLMFVRCFSHSNKCKRNHKYLVFSKKKKKKKEKFWVLVLFSVEFLFLLSLQFEA